MRLLACVLATVFLMAGCSGDSYDEESHRDTVEVLLGHEIGDWDGYVEAWRGICRSDEAVFAGVVWADIEDGRLAVTKLNVKHLCPDRMGELEFAADLMD